MSRSASLAIVVLSSFVFASSPARAQISSQEEPIAFIGHGAIFGPAGNEIAPTAKFIGVATRWYIDRLLPTLSNEQKAQFDAFRSTLTGNLTLDEHSALIVNTRLIDWLIEHGAPNDVDRLRAKNNLLKQILNQKLTDHSDIRFPRGIETFKRSPELTKRLDDLKSSKILSTTPNGSEAYRAECLANGVPIPPDFGPNSGWKSQGIIAKSELFIVRQDDAEVLTWTSNAPQGMCIALPRYNMNDIVEADGVICVGQVTSKVCFWDNQVKDADPFTFPRNSSQPFNRWAGGTDLVGNVGGVCSDCHAGENPYIIHGKLLMSLADVPLPTTPPAWYNPIVRSGDTTAWPENPGPMDAPPSCAACHGQASTQSDFGRLPKISSALPGYCRAVLRSSIGALAPPLPGILNAPASMPQGRRAGTLACTPGLPTTDPRYRVCGPDVTIDCTPTFGTGDPRLDQPDYPNAYRVSCTKEMADFLKLCDSP